MRVLIGLMAIVGLAAAAHAAGLVVDGSTTDYWSVRAPVENLRTDGSAVLYDIPFGNTGYLLADYKPVTGATPLDLSAEYAAHESISMTWKFDYTGTDPNAVDGSPMGMWIRVYSGTWDGSAWVMGARAGYFAETIVNGGYLTTTKDFGAPEDLYNGVPLDPANIYAVRLDVVFWEDKYTPATVGIDHFEVTPEPASLLLLAFGTLLRRR